MIEEPGLGRLLTGVTGALTGPIFTNGLGGSASLRSGGCL